MYCQQCVHAPACTLHGAHWCVYTGAYPFERPEDRNDAGKLQKMIQRILQVKYDMPKHISPECADLLRRILVPDPNKRLTIPEIQDHPWYLKDLPPGVKEMNSDLRTPTAGLQVGTSV